MTQTTFNKIAVTLLLLTIILLIVTLIALTIFIISSIRENDNINIDTTFADNNKNSDVFKIPLEEQYSTVFDWQIYTGDFGVEQLYFLKEQCDKYEIPMEIMLSIICTESSFRSTAKASTSSASGYCQIIAGTAEWVYEHLLKYGEYDIDNHQEIMTTNWKLNIEMGCRLMYCLYWNSSESWDIAIQKYHGGSPENNIAHLNRVNNNMFDLFAITTSDIK